MLQLVLVVSVSLLIAVDQWTKWLAIQQLKDNSPFVLIENVLELRYHENTGIAGGFLEGQRLLIAVVTGVVLVFLFVVLLSGRYRKSKMVNLGGCLVVGGGIGNLIDRVLHTDGSVVDFIYVKLIDFPIFNFADCCVVIGAILILIYFFFIYKEESTPLSQTAVHGEEHNGTADNADSERGAGGDTP